MNEEHPAQVGGLRHGVVPAGSPGGAVATLVVTGVVSRAVTAQHVAAAVTRSNKSYARNQMPGAAGSQEHRVLCWEERALLGPDLAPRLHSGAPAAPGG